MNIFILVGLRLLYLAVLAQSDWDTWIPCGYQYSWITRRSSVRSKDHVPFQAVVWTRGTLRPCGNFAPVFAYGTERWVSEICSARSHMLLTLSVRKFLNRVPPRCRHDRHECHWGHRSPLGSACPSSLPKTLHESKATCPKQECVGKAQGVCRSSSSSVLTHVAAPRVPHASTGRSDPSDHSLNRTQQPSVLGVPWLLTTRNKNLVIDCFDWGFSACFESGFNTRIGGLACGSKLAFLFFVFLLEKRNQQRQKLCEGGKSLVTALRYMARRGFIPSLGCAFTNPLAKNWEHHCNTVCRLSTFSVLLSGKK